MSNFFTSTEDAHKWVLDFLAIGPDSLTTTEFHQFFTQDAKLIFANNKEIPNLNALKAFFEPQFPLFESMKHDVLDLNLTPTKILTSLTITYVLRGDPEKQRIVVSAFSQANMVMRGEEPVMERFQVWMDGAPIAARANEVFGGS